MPSLSETIGVSLPNLPSKSTFLGGILIFLIAVIIALISTIIIYKLIQDRRFKLRIVKFHKVGNEWVKDIKLKNKHCTDLGRFQRINITGDKWLVLKNARQVLGWPEFQAGPNEFWYAERGDGQLINIKMGDIDLQMRKADVIYIDEDMRFQNKAIEDMFKDEYEKTSWIKKYGYIVGYIFFILMTTICIVIMFYNMSKSFDKLGPIFDKQDMITDKLDKIVTGLDNICSTSGIREAVFIPFIIPTKKRRKKDE